MYGGNGQFDGNAAFSGGGFMPSQATQSAADPSYSPAKNRDTQTLIPLTVKQISEAFQSSDDKMNFLIDGVEVNNVKLVGMLFGKTEKVTDIQFTIDDGTGRMDCLRWVNEAVDNKEMERVMNGMYVVVHGHLKGFQGKKHMMVYSVRPVIEYNEIASHFADCIYVHCYNTRLRKLQETATTSGHMPNTSFNTPVKGYQPSQSNHFSGQYSVDGLKGIDKLVLDYLQQPPCLTDTGGKVYSNVLVPVGEDCNDNCAREKGVHRNELAQHLNVPLQKILEAIESLESEGLVYSTIDECHYKSTANG